MPNNDVIAHDLTIVYLQNKNLSPEDLVQKYKETYKKFEDILKNEPIPTVEVFDF